jgi:hypothetical protein
MLWIIVLSTHVPRAGVENLKEKPGNISNFQFMADEKTQKLIVC